MPKRAPLLALLLSLVAPGLGQVYNGELKKGLSYPAVQLGVVLLFVLLGGTWGGFKFVIPFFFAAGLYGLYGLIDAYRTAKNTFEFTPKKYNRIWFYLAFFILSFGGGGAVTAYLRGNYLEAFKIPASAMEPTLVPGDHIIVDKRSYRDAPPVHGDVVVFTLESEPGINFIKRIVAVGGETLELRGRDLFINGNLVNEPYSRYATGGLKNYGPITVPPEKFLMFGDNRDRSKDSRYFVDGDGNPSPFVDVTAIKGKALYIYWSSGLAMNRIGTTIK